MKHLITLFAVNINESCAIESMLSNGMWTEIGPLAVNASRAKFSYECKRYQLDKTRCSSIVEEDDWVLDVVYARESGNLTMHAIVTAYYYRNLLDNNVRFSDRIAILFGCAAGIRSDGTEDRFNNAPSLGKTYLVDEAVWAENGKIETVMYNDMLNPAEHTQTGESNYAFFVDYTSFKSSKRKLFEIEATNNLTKQIVRLMPGLKPKKALCVDKVVELDMRLNNNLTYACKDGLTLRQLISSGGFQLLDMETYGFLIGLPEDVKSIPLRTVTDHLSNHADSNNKRLQQDLLDVAARGVLRELLDNVIDCNGDLAIRELSQFCIMAIKGICKYLRNTMKNGESPEERVARMSASDYAKCLKRAQATLPNCTFLTNTEAEEPLIKVLLNTGQKLAKPMKRLHEGIALDMRAKDLGSLAIDNDILKCSFDETDAQLWHFFALALSPKTNDMLYCDYIKVIVARCEKELRNEGAISKVRFSASQLKTNPNRVELIYRDEAKRRFVSTGCVFVRWWYKAPESITLTRLWPEQIWCQEEEKWVASADNISIVRQALILCSESISITQNR